MAQDPFAGLDAVEQDPFEGLTPAEQAAPAPARSRTAEDFIEPARRVIEAAVPGGRYLREAVDQGPEAAVRLAAQDLTIPSREGEKLGRSTMEQFSREIPGKFGMEPSPESEKQMGDLGAWLGHLGGKGIEILGLGAIMPGGSAAGAGLETLGTSLGRRAVHGALTFGAEGGASSLARGEGAGGVARGTVEGAALGAGLGAAGSVPGISEFYLSPKMKEGVMKAIMPRLLGTGAEAAVGGGFAAAQGGSASDVASNAAIFGLLGFLNNAGYSARARAAAKDTVIEPVVKAFVDSGMPQEQAVASARSALEATLAQAGQASISIRQHPNFPAFMDELAVKIRQASPELSEAQSKIMAEGQAAKMFINGEVSLEDLGKMKMEVKPGEGKPKTADQEWQDADAATKELPAPAKPAEVPEPIPDAEAQAMEQAIQRAQARSGGGDASAIQAALAMPPEVAPEAPQVPAESDAIEPVDGGDISFFEPTPEEVLRAPMTEEEKVLAEKEATAPVHELAPQEIAQRFPEASPAVQEQLLRRVAQSGYPISPEAVQAFPSLKGDVEEGVRAAAARAARGEEGALRPASDMLKRLGGVDAEMLKKNGEFSETKDIKGGIIKAGGQIRGWDHAAELLHEAGLIPERDAEAAKELILSESRKPARRGAGPGAAAKSSLGARIRKPDLLPEEIIRSLDAAGVKVGAKVPLIRAVNDPVFGKIKKGSEVSVISIDREGGNLLVEWKDPEQTLPADIAVIPIQAVAEVVRNAPAKQATPAEVGERAKKATGVTPEEQQIEMAESQLLRKKLRDEARGANRAMAEAKKTLRHELKQAWANEKWENATRNKIVEFAKAFLPPEARGTLLSRVANAHSPKDMLKAFYDIDEKSTLLANKAMMKNIRIIVDRVLASPTFPVGMKSRIREMLEDVRLENWSPKTVEKIRMQQEFLDELRADGADVTVPQSVFDQVSKLGKRPLSEMDSAELEEILTNLTFMVEQGRDIRRAILNLNELERLDKLADLVAGTKKIERPTTTGGVKRKFMGPALDWADARKNDWLKLTDFVQNAGIALKPIQVVVDELDGSFMGGGANRRVLWNPLQDGYISHQAAISDAHDFLAGVIKKHGALTPEQQDRVTVALMREQEGGREKLHQLDMTDDQIDAVKLEPAERATADALRGYLNDPKRVNALTRVTAMLYNQEFKAVKNYWPMMTDFNAPKEGSTAPEAVLSQIDLRRKNVEKGMLIERVEGAKQKIRSDVYAVFLAAAQQGSMIENMATPILRAHELIRDPKYLEVAGDAGQDFWRDYLDALARDGKISAARRNWTIDFFRKNLGVAALTFKPQTAFIQLSSMGSGAAITGGAHMREALTAGPEWEGFVDKNMPLIRERKGGDPAVKEVLDGGLMNKVKEKGFKHIVAMDHFAARQVALAAYFQWCDLHNVTPDPANPAPAGLRYAQSVPGRAMASPWLIDMPLALSRGNITGNASIDRTIFQFQSETLAKFSLITHQVFGRGEAGPVEMGKQPDGSYAKRAESLAWLGASLLYESGVKAAWISVVLGSMYALGMITKKQLDDRVNWNDLAWKNLGMNALGTIPFVGSVGNYIAYDSGPIPLIDVVGDVFKGSANLATGAVDGKSFKSARGLIQAMTAMATLAGVPAAGVVGWLARQPLRGRQDKRSKAKSKGGSW